MRKSLRRRMVLLFVIFTAVLSVVAIAAILWVYHRVEDRMLERRLSEALASSSDSMLYTGAIDGAPEPYRALLDGAAPGRYEWELEGREAHGLVVDSPVDRARRVAIYAVGEAESSEALFEVTLWIAAGLAFLGALTIARHLAVRAVTPIEKLTARLSAGGLASLPAGLADGLDDDEVGVLAATLDEAGTRLQASIERERRFLREASHELRTPVTIIQGAYDLIAETLDGADVDNHRRLDRIGRSLRRIDLSLTSLLAMARAEHRASVEPTPLRAALADVVEEVRTIAGPRVEVVADFESAPDRPATNPLLAIALSNLLRNAAENTEEGEVLLRLTETHAVVQDTGPGFPAELLSPPDGLGRSAGLGLATVERICSRCGWRLELENHAAGARATLRFAAESEGADSEGAGPEGNGPVGQP